MWRAGTSGTPGRGCLPSANVTIDAHSSAAHRGGYGLRVIDSDTQAGSGAQAQVDVTTSNLASAYLRFWFRVRSSNAQGWFLVAQIWGNPPGTNLSLFDLSVLGDGSVSVAGATGTGAFVGSTNVTNLQLGTWYLIELELFGPSQ